MKKNFITVILTCLLLSTEAYGAAKEGLTLEFLAGDAYIFKTPLTISQSGYDEIDLTAKYKANSFEHPIYYSIRAGKWEEGSAWELELIHLKIELDNRTSEVERFEISHGYNLLTVNRAWEYKKFIIRVGAGLVIAHPESRVRGQSFDEHQGLLNKGYYFSGLTAQGALQKKFYLSENFYFSVEGKLSASYAKVDIAEGEAKVPNITLHALMGAGWDF